MQDLSTKTRKKRLFAAEIRYKPLLPAFDERGAILADLRNKLEKDFQHWKIADAQLTLLDDLETPARQIHISHLRAVVSFEDADTLDSFYKNVCFVFDFLCNKYPIILSSVTRLGVRFLTIHNLNRAHTLEDISKKTKAVFSSDQHPLKDSTDFTFIFKTSNRRVCLGPVKANEGWVKKSFQLTEKNVPEVGFACDVDSFIENPSPKDTLSLLKIMDSLEELTIKTEYEIIKALNGSK